MRLKRTQNDFRVNEILDDNSLLSEGSFAAYRVTKRGLTTFEAADLLAQAAGVERSAVAYAGLKDKDGITSQIMTVEGGKPVTFRDKAMTIRPLGRASRAIESSDSKGNSFEIFVRDLEADDMRRIRVNLNQVRKMGLPNYFDDQRFGCLRHGQGFVVRSLLRNDYQGALRALLAAPSRYGMEPVEKFKHGIQKRWGHWQDLADYTRNRRGFSVFEHLKSNPDDFRGALEKGVATRERTIHLFAFQSHLWNRAVAIKIQEVVAEADLAWLPCDAGSLPVYRGIDPDIFAELKGLELPLLGPDTEMTEEVERLYKKVFRHEGLPMSAFLSLDLSGFRPQSEMRPVLMDPEFLRAAPAETDEIYRRRQKMRVRFSLPRGHYATLVCKRLLMPTDKDYMALRIWVARHPLDWPNDAGQVPAETDFNDRRHYSERGHERGYHSPGSRDFNNGSRHERPVFVRGGHDEQRDNFRGNQDDQRGGGGGGYGQNRDNYDRGGRDFNRDNNDRGGRDFQRDGRPDFQRADNRGGGNGYGGNRDDHRNDHRNDHREGNRGVYGDNRNQGDSRGYGNPRDDHRGGGFRGPRDDNRGGAWGGQQDGNRNDRNDRNDRGYQGQRDDNRGQRADHRGGPSDDRGQRPDHRGGPSDDRSSARDDNGGGVWGGKRPEQREDHRSPREDNQSVWGKPRDSRKSSETREERPEKRPAKPSPSTDSLPADSPWAKAMQSKKVSNDDE